MQHSIHSSPPFGGGRLHDDNIIAHTKRPKHSYQLCLCSFLFCSSVRRKPRMFHPFLVSRLLFALRFSRACRRVVQRCKRAKWMVFNSGLGSLFTSFAGKCLYARKGGRRLLLPGAVGCSFRILFEFYLTSGHLHKKT